MQAQYNDLKLTRSYEFIHRLYSNFSDYLANVLTTIQNPLQDPTVHLAVMSPLAFSSLRWFCLHLS